MELDGYNQDLKIAFEYNGIQHYRVGRFSETDEALKQRKLDDRRKSIECKKNQSIYLSYHTNKIY